MRDSLPVNHEWDHESIRAWLALLISLYLNYDLRVLYILQKPPHPRLIQENFPTIINYVGNYGGHRK